MSLGYDCKPLFGAFPDLLCVLCRAVISLYLLQDFFCNGTHGLGKPMKKDIKKISVCGKNSLEFLRLSLSTEF